MCACPGVIGREHAADEGDDREAVLAVIAQRVDIPPRIAAGRDRAASKRGPRAPLPPPAGPRSLPSALPVPDACCRPPDKGPACGSAPPAVGTRPSSRATPVRRARRPSPETAASKSFGVVLTVVSSRRVIVQAAALQQPKCPLLALRDLRWSRASLSPVGGALTRQSSALRTSDAVRFGTFLIVAILRADVDGRFGRQPAAPENVVELCRHSRSRRTRCGAASGKPCVFAVMAQVMADSERAEGGTCGTAAATSRPNRPSATAATSALHDDRVRVDALAARPASRRCAAALHGSISRASVAYRNVAPLLFARSASARAMRCMPPSTSQTPSRSTCATSISVAGARNGDEPQ